MQRGLEGLCTLSEYRGVFEHEACKGDGFLLFASTDAPTRRPKVAWGMSAFGSFD